MAKSAAKKMATFSLGVFAFSLLGLLLLAMPLVLVKKYPGKQGVLFKYSALAALTFFLTVNLFGGVLYGMKTVQGALGSATNPGLAIASGTFDTLDENAEDYIVMGKELFVPTLMRASPILQLPVMEVLRTIAPWVGAAAAMYLAVTGVPEGRQRTSLIDDIVISVANFDGKID